MTTKSSRSSFHSALNFTFSPGVNTATRPFWSWFRRNTRRERFDLHNSDVSTIDTDDFFARSQRGWFITVYCVNRSKFELSHDFSRAAEGNRTPISTLQKNCSTIELQRQFAFRFQNKRSNKTVPQNMNMCTTLLAKLSLEVSWNRESLRWDRHMDWTCPTWEVLRVQIAWWDDRESGCRYNDYPLRHSSRTLCLQTSSSSVSTEEIPKRIDGPPVTEFPRPVEIGDELDREPDTENDIDIIHLFLHRD